MKLEDINTKTKDAVDYLVQSLESEHSEVLTQYLGAMARFHTYSFGNVMLIARQKPDASNVAGIRTWNSLGRFKKRAKNDDAKPSEDAKGTVPTLFGFRAVYVLDRLSRDLRPSLCALDGSRLCHFGSPSIVASTSSLNSSALRNARPDSRIPVYGIFCP